MSAATLYADGASRGNPGPAGAGACLVDAEGNVLAEVSVALGKTTNNVAEYQALIHGLKKAQQLQIQKLKILMDSQLVVRQVRGEYRVKQEHLQTLHREALSLLRDFPGYVIDYIPRERNQLADRLANRGVEGGV